MASAGAERDGARPSQMAHLRDSIRQRAAQRERFLVTERLRNERHDREVLAQEAAAACDAEGTEEEERAVVTSAGAHTKNKRSRGRGSRAIGQAHATSKARLRGQQRWRAWMTKRNHGPDAVPVPVRPRAQRSTKRQQSRRPTFDIRRSEGMPIPSIYRGPIRPCCHNHVCTAYFGDVVANHRAFFLLVGGCSKLQKSLGFWFATTNARFIYHPDSGAVNIAGAPSIQEAYAACVLLMDFAARHLGINLRLIRLETHNIHFACRIGPQIDLRSAEAVFMGSQHRVPVINRLSIQLDLGFTSCMVNVFDTGNIVVLGVPTVPQAQKLILPIANALAPFVRPATLPAAIVRNHKEAKAHEERERAARTAVDLGTGHTASAPPPPPESSASDSEGTADEEQALGVVDREVNLGHDWIWEDAEASAAPPRRKRDPNTRTRGGQSSRKRCRRSTAAVVNPGTLGPPLPRAGPGESLGLPTPGSISGAIIGCVIQPKHWYGIESV